MLVILLVVVEVVSMEQAVCYDYQPAGQKSFSVEIIDRNETRSKKEEEVNKREERIKDIKKQRLKQALEVERQRERERERERVRMKS